MPDFIKNNPANITVRQFRLPDWQIFKEMRLHSLKTEPHVFSRKWEEEAFLPDERWLNDLSEDHLGFFGLFDGDNLIGITGVFPDKSDATGKTAKLGLSYILPPYRGQGLSRLFYEARIAWVVSHPVYECILVSHRRSNEISRRANQRFNFVYTHTLPSVTWPDGGVDEEICYKLDIAELKL